MFATVFFTALGATGIAACFGLGLVAPLLAAFRLLHARFALQLGGRAAGRRVMCLSEQPLRPQLSAAQRRFAADTRSLLADLDHACSHIYRFSDSPFGPWWQQVFASLSDSAYASAIGINGEVWRWLRQAEALLDNAVEPADPSLETATITVRAMLFDARPLGPRLEVLVAVVARVDDGLRTHGGAPYRDQLAAPRPSPADSVTDPQASVSGAQRRRRYDQALEVCGNAIQAIVRRYAEPPEHDDLYQEIRLAVWNALPAYRGDSSLRTYVLRIARYRAITFKQRRVVLDGEREWLDRAPPPDELLDETRERRALGRAIKGLPAKLRFALEMRLEGFTYREIAQRLAITEKNASVRVSRARQAVKRSLCAEAG